MTTDYFFNADGTVGIRESERSASFCDAGHGYSLRGDSLAMSVDARGQAGWHLAAVHRLLLEREQLADSLHHWVRRWRGLHGHAYELNSSPTNSCLVVAIRH